MATTELTIRQLADEGGTTPIAPVTVTDAVLKGDGTTLTDELTALNNDLTDFTTFKYTTIPADSDLDDFTNAGMYGCPSSSTAATLSNCPSSTTFALLVMSKALSTPIQIIFESSRIYTRIKTSSGWNRWFVHEGTAVS